MRRLLVMIGFVLAALPAVAAAGDYASGFGIRISVPESYLVLGRDEVRESADFFAEGGGGTSDRFEAIPEAMRREVYDRVSSGQLEIFYRTGDVDPSFVDNVNIMQQRAELPSGASELRQVCELLPGEFSRVFGRPISMDGCEMRMVAQRPALYLAFDGALPGTKTLQYQIRSAPGQTLIVTATAKDENLPRMMGEFESMIASIRLP